MTRLTSIEKGGYYAFPDEHLAAVASLLAPAKQGGKFLDPCAGEGRALDALSRAWRVTPYANEIEDERAALCKTLFGAAQTVHGDMYQLKASTASFVGLWVNPPYSWDSTADEKRREFAMLKHAWKWAQPDALVFWVVYGQHVTHETAAFLTKHSTAVDVWRLPGLHLGEYTHIVAVARVGTPVMDPARAAVDLVQAGKTGMWPLLTLQESPCYALPAPIARKSFIFCPKVVSPEAALEAIGESGIQFGATIQALVQPEKPPEKITPVVRPRGGQLALILAAGLFNGLVLPTDTGRMAVRSTVRSVEVQTEGASEVDESDQATVEREVYRTQSVVTITLLGEDGSLDDISGDGPITAFIKTHKAALMSYLDDHFAPLYNFDFAPLKDLLARPKRGKLYQTQKHVIAACVTALKQRKAAILVGEPGSGKAQPLTAKIMTPSGWKLMGDIQVGDVVTNPDGGTANVVGVFPQGNKAIFRVTFSDGSFTESCDEHLWKVIRSNRKRQGRSYEVLPLKEIARKLRLQDGRANWYIPMTQPVGFEAKGLPLDAYLLGVLLGDGSLASGNAVGFTSADQEILDEVSRVLPENVALRQNSQYGYNLTVGRNIHDGNGCAYNPLVATLRQLDLMGRDSLTKFIPEMYKYASIKDRIALLQGLFDTDGCVCHQTSVEYTSISPDLVNGVVEIVHSLGGTTGVYTRTSLVYHYKGKVCPCNQAYRVRVRLPGGILPFRLIRKASAYKPFANKPPMRSIKKIECVGVKPAQCIMLDSDNHLYVTDDYIVTHNTIMGGTVAAALHSEMKPGQVVIIMCPPHLVEKWQREIKDVGVSVYSEILKNVEDVVKFMDKVAVNDKRILNVGIVSRETAKLGEGWSPAVIWDTTRCARWAFGELPPVDEDGCVIQCERLAETQAAYCPTCGEMVTTDTLSHAQSRSLKREPGYKPAPPKEDSAPANAAWIARMPRFCVHCGSALWMRERTFSKGKLVNGQPKNPRVPLSEFIARRYGDRLYLYIADELHELKSASTDQGEAMSMLANAATKTLGLTGTLYGGAASTLYAIEYLFNPRIRHKYPWGRGLNQWVREMGCLERIVEFKPQYDRAGVYSGKRRVEQKPREAPGCSPLLVAQIIDHCVFVGLSDMGRKMPDFEEVPVPIQPDPDVEVLYSQAKSALSQYLFQCRLQGDASALGMYLQTLLSWPSAPYRTEHCIHRKRLDKDSDLFVEIPVHTIPALAEDRLYAKEQWLIDIVREELAQDRGVAVFVRQTGVRDLQPRVAKLLTDHIPQARPYILKSSVKADCRESLLDTQVAAGVNVLVCNPRLVQTGLDLLAFPTIVFAEVDYSLYVMGQASRRAWRLIQDQPCKVFYPYYEGLMENQAVALIGRKQQAAALLYGERTSGGLSALGGNDGGNLLAALAAELDLDSSVTDLRDLFAKHTSAADAAESAWLTDYELEAVDAVERVPDLHSQREPDLYRLAEAYDETAQTQSEPDEAMALFNRLQMLAAEIGATSVKVLDLPTEPTLPTTSITQQSRKTRKVDLSAAPHDAPSTSGVETLTVRKPGSADFGLQLLLM